MRLSALLIPRMIFLGRLAQQAWSIAQLCGFASQISTSACRRPVCAARRRRLKAYTHEHTLTATLFVAKFFEVEGRFSPYLGMCFFITGASLFYQREPRRKPNRKSRRNPPKASNQKETKQNSRTKHNYDPCHVRLPELSRAMAVPFRIHVPEEDLAALEQSLTFLLKETFCLVCFPWVSWFAF